MTKTIAIYKPVGKTPLEMITLVKKQYPEISEEKIAYAGRLDPMAEGLLLLLVGEECKKRMVYQQLHKEYEFEVLFGVSTDTYDVMGMIQEVSTHSPEEIHINVPSFKGKRMQQYPPFSSARVNGKPLYYWARENTLDQIKIPTKEIEVFSIKQTGTRLIGTKELMESLEKKIQQVHGEFRQQEIIKKWQQSLSSNLTFPIYKFEIVCSSGTYVRSFAYEMGKKMGIPSLAFSIKRTRVGDYLLKNAVKVL